MTASNEMRTGAERSANRSVKVVRSHNSRSLADGKTSRGAKLLRLTPFTSRHTGESARCVTSSPTTERKTTMTDKTKVPGSEVFDQALKNYEQALRTGLKLQEEAGRCFTKLLNHAGSPQDLQKQVTAIAHDFIPATQKSMEGYLELLEQNSRASVDLLKKGLETSQPTTFAETPNKVVEFCEASLKSLKANAQAVVDINAKAIDSWVSLVKKATAEVAEPKAEKA
jgi:hypothetical protein